MTEICNKCNQELLESDKTLVGKQFKHCSRCRAINRTYQTKFAECSNYYHSQQWKDIMKQYQQRPEYKEYQDQYRKLYHQTPKYKLYQQHYRRYHLLNMSRTICISNKEYTEKDFEISFQ
jgi:hypothetical protein